MVRRTAYVQALSGALVRLLLAATGALAAGGDVQAAALAGGYAILAVAYWATSPWRPRWASWPATVMDLAAAGALAWLAPASIPAWALLLFPLLLAGAAGIAQTLLTGAVVLAVYVARLYPSDLLQPSALWAGLILVAVTAAVGALRSSWIADARERLANDRAEAAEERYVRERALARIASDLGSFERGAIERALIGAVHEALQATCEVRAAPSSAPAGDPGEDGLYRAALTLGSGLELAVARYRPLRTEERAWLERVAAAGTEALARSSAHADLQTEADRLLELWRSSPVPAVVTGSSGEVLYANDQYLALGLGEAQPVPNAEDPLEHEVSAGEPRRTFVIARTTLESGRVLTVYREITRERQALQAREELLSLVGHELRGPLTSIHGFTQMMARNLSTVQQQASQLDRLISDLMSKPTLEHGQLGLDFQKVDLERLVRAAAERFGVAEPERRLQVRAHPVPQILADPTRLNQVLDNLLTNAAKYSPPEAPIELGLEALDEAAILWVADRGVGIAPEHLERLFDRFYRVPEAERQQAQGLGLGLAIVHDLVTAHGGRVWAESRGPGQGSTFYVRLPLPDAAPDQAGPGLKGAGFLGEPEAESG